MTDPARAEMRLQANMLGAGADMAVAPQWLVDRAAADATADCPHMFDDELTVPLFHYPFSGVVRCGLCPMPPEPFCLLCGAGAVREIAALSGLIVVVFALCAAHRDALADSDLT